MIEIPHHKIVVVGGELKETTKVSIRGYCDRTSDPISISASFEIENTKNHQSTYFDTSSNFVSYKALECNLRLSEVIGMIKIDSDTDIFESICELVYFRSIRCIRFDLRKHGEFIGGHLALKNGMVFSDETPEGIAGVAKHFFKLR